MFFKKKSINSNSKFINRECIAHSIDKKIINKYKQISVWGILEESNGIYEADIYRNIICVDDKKGS